MVFHCSEKILETFCSSVQKSLQKRLLIRLEATGDTELIDTTAAIDQTAFTDILSCAGSIYITTSIH